MSTIPTAVVIRPDRPATREKFITAVKPIKRDSLKNFVTPGKVLTIEFNSAIEESSKAKRNISTINV
jgi:hypothetical protein